MFEKKDKHINVKILFIFCSLLLSFAQSLEGMTLASLLPSVCTQEAINNKNTSIKILESNTLLQGVSHIQDVENTTVNSHLPATE